MKLPSLKARFFFWIFSGLIVFSIATFVGYPTICSTQNGMKAGNANERNPGSKQQVQNIVNSKVVPLSFQASNQNGLSENQKVEVMNHDFGMRSILCNELKITDVALVFFTYCLVIIGWFQIRNSENTMKDLERAVLFCGMTSPVNMASGTSMTFTVGNYGRSTAIAKEIYYEFSQTEPSGNTPIYKSGKTIVVDMGIKPNMQDTALGADVPNPLSPFTVDHHAFGYIKYEDIFRRPHINRFCMKIVPGVGVKTAGSPAWNDWD